MPYNLSVSLTQDTVATQSHRSDLNGSKCMIVQKGFTLLELMLSMAIFAVLAVVGWQVFDTINTSKERADLQTDVLTELQYGYQQIQRDLIQVVAYQLPGSDNEAVTDSGSLLGPANTALSSQAVTTANPTPSFNLENNELSFIRYADPDPRYMQSDHLERIVYTFSEDALLRKRYATLQSNSNEQPLSSVIISGVNGGSGTIQALLPQPSATFPDEQGGVTGGSSGIPLTSSGDNGTSMEDTNTLPKGVMVSFSVLMGSVDTPVSWTYALQEAVTKPQQEASTTAETPTNGQSNQNSQNENNGQGQQSQGSQNTSTQSNTTNQSNQSTSAP